MNRLNYLTTEDGKPIKSTNPLHVGIYNTDGSGEAFDFATQKQVVCSGAVVSATDNTLAAAASTFPNTALAGLTVNITSGTGEGQTATIASNNTTALTLTADWGTNPDNTSTFEVVGSLADIIGQMTGTPADYTVLARLKVLATLIGEVQASPTANTLLARIKSLEDKIAGIIAGTTPAVTTLSRSNMELYGATVAARPLATAVTTGAIFMAINTQEIWQSNGTDWVVI